MNRRVLPKKKGRSVEDRKRLCGECKLLIPSQVFWHLNYKGEPIIGACIHSTNRKRFLSERACDKFEEK